MRWFKSRSEGFWWVLSAIVVSVVGFILLYVGWEWLRSESQESRGTKIRNAFLIIGGLVAVLLVKGGEIMYHLGGRALRCGV